MFCTLLYLPPSTRAATIRREQKKERMAENNGSKDSGKTQDSTAKLPMVDLKTTLDAVIAIRDKAVETAPMPSVAKALGYAHTTSTPFYRRIVAARLFNLLSQKTSLTQEAINYIKPHDEGMKADVLKNAVQGIPAYADLIARYFGKKINVVLVANAIGKEFKLSDACAITCAKAFEASLLFAGMISPEGIVEANNNSIPKPPQPPTPDSNGSGAHRQNREDAALQPAPTSSDGTNTQQHTIFLDKGKSRKFVINAPLEITRAEYDRICKWLEFTLIIVEQAQEGKP